ncbi:MAG TPA: type I-E CRISPR-associated protein Cas5/CasD [Anaerolineaceae bacterium]|nr:type I-E CRISPR-associated protein Cas5/CasD [Anaerolineaceae bacterium]
MDTLLLRLIAPQQSWGVQSHYTIRDSGKEPSKSGVIGLLCAALGRPREADVADLAALRMGVRVDREGTLRSDYHIAQNVLDSDGKGTRDSIVTNRYYLADAAFLVGLQGDFALLQLLQEALRHPVWAIYLGRKAFTPAAPVWLPDGLQAGLGLEDALCRYGWITRRHAAADPAGVRVVLEMDDGMQVRQDVPISFAARRFSSRRVSTRLVPAPSALAMEVI